MNILTHLLAVALSLTQPWYLPSQAPETPAERTARITTIVTAAVDVDIAPEWPGTRGEMAAALLALTWYESRRWALEVHDGRVRGDHRHSVCLAQVWTRDETLVGTSYEATRRCMQRAAEILVLHAGRCRVRRLDFYGAAVLVTAYGRGRGCTPARWAEERVRLWQRFAAVTYAPEDDPLASRL